MTRNAIEQKYATELFGRRFETLSDAERDEIWIAIIIASGRARLDGIWFEDKVRQFMRVLAVCTGFICGGAGTLAFAEFVIHPGEDVLGFALNIIPILAGIAAFKVFGYFWPEP